MSNLLEHERWVSPEEYLAAEELAETKHEYVGGVVYAMAGGINLHHIISMNLYVALQNQLAGTKCRTFSSDALLRIKALDHELYYYPDATVICTPVDLEQRFLENPSALFEVISESTERTDRQEKAAAYRTILPLEAYVIVETKHRGLTIHRRTPSGWQLEYLKGRDDVLQLPGIGCTLRLDDIYAGTNL